MDKNFDFDNYSFRIYKKETKPLVCKVIDCYQANEYLDAYINDDICEETKENIEKHLKDCPYCAYDYENFCEMRKKINYEMAKNSQSTRSIVRAKFLEYTITSLVVVVFLTSIFYFFLKLNVFSKVEKGKDIQEISETESFY